jgi:hypothetical protein
MNAPSSPDESQDDARATKARPRRAPKVATDVDSESEEKWTPPARGWWIEIDGRGETITYREPDRWAEIFWGAMTSGDIERASLRGWLTSGPIVPMTSAEEDLVIERILDSGRSELGLNLSVRD